MTVSYREKETGKKKYINKISYITTIQEYDDTYKVFIFQCDKIIKKLNLEEIDDLGVIGEKDD